MPKFKVYLAQHVEEIACVEIEAASAEEAREFALEKDDLVWAEGQGTVDPPNVYRVDNSAGETVYRY